MNFRLLMSFVPKLSLNCWSYKLIIIIKVLLRLRVCYEFSPSLTPPLPLPLPSPPTPPYQLPFSSPFYHRLSHIFLPSLPIHFYFHHNSHLLVCIHTPFVIPLSLLVYAHRHTPYNHPHCLINLLCLHLHCYPLSPYLN